MDEEYTLVMNIVNGKSEVTTKYRFNNIDFSKEFCRFCDSLVRGMCEDFDASHYRWAIEDSDGVRLAHSQSK